MRTIFGIMMLCLLAGAGCNPAGKFAVVEAGMPSMNGLASLHGRAVVENGGSRDLTIESAVVTVRYRDRELGGARLMLPVVIPAGSVTGVRYDLALERVSMASVQTLTSRIVSNPGAVTVDLDGWIRWGRWRKKIELRGVEATRFVGIIF